MKDYFYLLLTHANVQREASTIKAWVLRGSHNIKRNIPHTHINAGVVTVLYRGYSLLINCCDPNAKLMSHTTGFTLK